MAESVETMAMNNFKNRVTTIIESGKFAKAIIDFDDFVNGAVNAKGRKLLFSKHPKEGLGVSAKTIDKENESIKICWKDVATVQEGNGSSGRYSVVVLNEDADIHGISDAISKMANAKLIINSCFFYAGSKKILNGLSTDVRGMSVAVQKAEELNDKKEKLEDAIEEHNDDVKKLDEDTTDFNKDVEKHNEKVDKNEKAVENAKTDTDAEKAQKEQEKLKQEAEALEKQRQEMEKQRQELEKQKKQVEQEQQAAQTQLAKTNTPEKVATVEPVTIQIVQTEEKPAKIEQPKETAAPAKESSAPAELPKIPDKLVNSYADRLYKDEPSFPSVAKAAKTYLQALSKVEQAAVSYGVLELCSELAKGGLRGGSLSWKEAFEITKVKGKGMNLAVLLSATSKQSVVNIDATVYQRFAEKGEAFIKEEDVRIEAAKKAEEVKKIYSDVKVFEDILTQVKSKIEKYKEDKKTGPTKNTLMDKIIEILENIKNKGADARKAFIEDKVTGILAARNGVQKYAIDSLTYLVTNSGHMDLMILSTYTGTKISLKEALKYQVTDNIVTGF